MSYKLYLNTSVKNTPIEWSRMAGYFDGEGCVLVGLENRAKARASGRWTLELCSGDVENLLLFHKAGGSPLYLKKRSGNQRVIAYRCSVRGSSFLEVALELEPYLLVKQPQVSYAIDSYCRYREARLSQKPELAEEIAIEAHAKLQQLKRHNHYAN